MFKVGLLVLCQFFYANENPTAVNGKAPTPHQLVGSIVQINQKEFYTSKVGKDGNTYAFKDTEEYLEIAGNDSEETHYFIKSKACTPVISKEDFEKHEGSIEEKKPAKEVKADEKKEESKITQAQTVQNETMNKVVSEVQKTVEAKIGTVEAPKKEEAPVKTEPKKKAPKRKAAPVVAPTPAPQPKEEDDTVIVKSKVEGLEEKQPEVAAPVVEQVKESAPVATPSEAKIPTELPKKIVAETKKEEPAVEKKDDKKAEPASGFSGVLKDIVNGISK